MVTQASWHLINWTQKQLIYEEHHILGLWSISFHLFFNYLWASKFLHPIEKKRFWVSKWLKIKAAILSSKPLGYFIGCGSQCFVVLAYTAFGGYITHCGPFIMVNSTQNVEIAACRLCRDCRGPCVLFWTTPWGMQIHAARTPTSTQQLDKAGKEESSI